eukprot:7379930-Prymnesium_polylepis.5
MRPENADLHCPCGMTSQFGLAWLHVHTTHSRAGPTGSTLVPAGCPANASSVHSRDCVYGRRDGAMQEDPT